MKETLCCSMYTFCLYFCANVIMSHISKTNLLVCITFSYGSTKHHFTYNFDHEKFPLFHVAELDLLHQIYFVLYWFNFSCVAGKGRSCLGKIFFNHLYASVHFLLFHCLFFLASYFKINVITQKTCKNTYSALYTHISTSTIKVGILFG